MGVRSLTWWCTGVGHTPDLILSYWSIDPWEQRGSRQVTFVTLLQNEWMKSKPGWDVWLRWWDTFVMSHSHSTFQARSIDGSWSLLSIALDTISTWLPTTLSKRCKPNIEQGQDKGWEFLKKLLWNMSISYDKWLSFPNIWRHKYALSISISTCPPLSSGLWLHYLRRPSLTALARGWCRGSEKAA